MKRQDDHKAILLTPAGTGAIAVVRLTGLHVRNFVSKHFNKPLQLLHCVHGTIHDGDRSIDDAVVVQINDHCADINLHGGVWVVRQIIELARREGFEVFDSPTDVPMEAYDSDDEIEREMLAAIPLARTEFALRALTAQPAAWRSIQERNIEAILNDRALWWLLHPPRVAIVGAPNVGKSTLANQLFGQNRSITADVPGTTRDWVGESADVGGLLVTLVDTPGVRETADSIEREAIERSGEVVKSADLVILVVDSSRRGEPEQSNLLQNFPDGLLVENKADLPRKFDPGDRKSLKIVATRGDGVDELRAAIRAFFGVDQLDESLPRWWTADQRNRLLARFRH